MDGCGPQEREEPCKKGGGFLHIPRYSEERFEQCDTGRELCTGNLSVSDKTSQSERLHEASRGGAPANVPGNKNRPAGLTHLNHPESQSEQVSHHDAAFGPF